MRTNRLKLYKLGGYENLNIAGLFSIPASHAGVISQPKPLCPGGVKQGFDSPWLPHYSLGAGSAVEEFLQSFVADFFDLVF